MYSGNDSSIISFTAHFLKEYYVTSIDMLNADQLALLDKIFNKVSLLNSSLPLNFFDADKFNFYVYATLLRFKQKGKFDVPKLNSLFFSEISSLKTEFERVFNIELTNDLIFRLELLINNDSYMLDYSALIASAKTDKKKTQTLTNLTKLVDNLCKTLQITCSDHEQLLLNLYNFTAFTYGSEYVLFPRYQFFLNSLIEYYPTFFNLIKKDVEDVVSYTDLEKSHEFIYHLILNWPELQVAFHKFNPKMNVGVYFYTDTEHNYWIKRFLEKYFSEKLSITVLYDKQNTIKEQDYETYDLLLTNKALFDLDYTNVICCSLFPTDEQLASIHSFYTNWTHSRS